ncbi:MAG: S53 family peptidase [Terriglobales bacterium]
MKAINKSLRISIRQGPMFAQLFALVALLAVSGFAQSSGRAVAKTQNLGPENPSKVITVTVWLQQHNKAALDEMVRSMYRPGSQTYHHFLTREQYRSQFAPTAADAAQVRDYLLAHNFTVTSADKFNHYLVAQGRVRDVQNAFNVQLSQMNFNGNIHRVTSGAASVHGPVGELIHAVEGLANFAPRPTLARGFNPATGKPFAPQPVLTVGLENSPTCLNGTQNVTFTSGSTTATYSGNRYASDATAYCPGYTPAQIQTAYGLNALYNQGLDGTGQTIIIVDAWGSNTILQDANTFASTYGLPQLTSSNFQIYYPGGETKCHDGCEGWNFETTLDVEWAHATAPGANIILIIAPDNDSLDIAELWAIENPEFIHTPYANHDLGYVISNSWLDFEEIDLLYGDQGELDTEYEMTELAAALGISTHFASGDWGDNVQYLRENYGIQAPPSVCMPASAPYATGVGGSGLFLDDNNNIQYQPGYGHNITQLTGAGGNPPYDPPLELGFFSGAGGGASAVWPEPAFQSSLGSAYRQVPDISYLADALTGVNIIITLNGVPTVQGQWGGTSLATPMFSGLWAIANQAAGSKAPLGQAAPMLYSLPADAITDVIPVDNGSDVSGEITDPPLPPLILTAADLAQPLENTTTFLSAFIHGISAKGKSSPWYVVTFGTDSSLVTAPGWDNVTGLGVPNGLNFVEAVVAAAP